MQVSAQKKKKKPKMSPTMKMVMFINKPLFWSPYWNRHKSIHLSQYQSKVISKIMFLCQASTSMYVLSCYTRMLEPWKEWKAKVLATQILPLIVVISASTSNDVRAWLHLILIISKISALLIKPQE
ncbi:uncharacterized protein LOC105800942 [Gossypium raimondii]|uniref:uncharacterized protein LOC105800942 n=1 Tax=Gossypium raimondii TaxID=29730 RepID=UPI00227A3961|nr:uncharacterized protein LOC105800942 [Gossypium raimondii]